MSASVVDGVLTPGFSLDLAGCNDYSMFSSLEIDYTGAWVEAIWWCTRKKERQYGGGYGVTAVSLKNILDML